MTQFQTLTARMNILENRIAELNRKYKYDISLGTASEIAEYEATAKRWDALSRERNQLKAA